MRRIIIESPFAGDVDRNVSYARACLIDSLRRGEAPIASHLLYPQVLNDLEPSERTMGIEAGLAWLEVAELHVFYLDLGWSNGMRTAFERAQAGGSPTEFRTLGQAWEGR